APALVVGFANDIRIRSGRPGTDDERIGQLQAVNKDAEIRHSKSLRGERDADTSPVSKASVCLGCRHVDTASGVGPRFLVCPVANVTRLVPMGIPSVCLLLRPDYTQNSHELPRSGRQPLLRTPPDKPGYSTTRSCPHRSTPSGPRAGWRGARTCRIMW